MERRVKGLGMEGEFKTLSDSALGSLDGIVALVVH